MSPLNEWSDLAVRARKVGQWSKRAPYGYALRKQRLILGAAEARETVRWLFNEYANTTASLVSLARSLNARQVRTVEGGAWYESTIYRILTSPVYCGHMARRRKLAGALPVIIARDTHEPLIEQAVFDRVQQRLKGNRHSAGKRTDQRRPQRRAPQYPDLQPEAREARLKAKLERMMLAPETAKPSGPRRKRRIGTSSAFRRRRPAVHDGGGD